MKENSMTKEKKTNKDEKLRKQLIHRILRIKGKYSSVLSSSENFALQKQEEIRVER